MALPNKATALSAAPQARVCLAKHSEVTAAAQARSVTRVAIPAGAPGWRSTLDATCTHGSSAAARETLLTSGAEFGEVMSPAQSERAERGGALKKTAHLHHVEGGKHSQSSWTAVIPWGSRPGAAHTLWI